MFSRNALEKRHILQQNPFFCDVPVDQICICTAHTFPTFPGNQQHPVLRDQNKMSVKIVIFYFHD
jgi:hypothetical protein